MFRRLLPLAAVAVLAGCGYPFTPPALTPVTAPAPPASGAAYAAPVVAAADTEVRAPVTILLSLDGFRADYLRRGATPTLDALVAGGVGAAMRPSFPSKTFPNHWTLVTGLRPDRHGIVANTMEDPARAGATFRMGDVDPFWWNAAEPIWVTAERAGIRTASAAWPGSDVAWRGTKTAHGYAGGTRPSDWQPFADDVTPTQRLAAVVDWLRRPAATRPRLVLGYLDQVDEAGHEFGPRDARTLAAVRAVDAAIGALVAELRALGQPANLVIVADHGMAETSDTRVIALDTLLPPADARVIETGPYAALYPQPGRDAAVAALLRPHAHMRCWRKAAIPARLHYGTNARVAPFLCLADDDARGAWTIERSAPTQAFTKGAHGYDPEAADMRALFVANGPAFARGRTLAPFDNVAVAPLLRDLLALPPGTGLDGDNRPFRGVTRR